MLPYYTNGISWGLLVITTFIISSVNPVSGQISFQNTPPVINVDRNWRLSESEPIGSMVTRVRAEDAENDILEFGLEPTTIFNGPSLSAKSSQSSGKSKMPFRIDPNTGVVHLNESLSGRGGESFFLFVTVFDGQLTAKTEVYVNVFPKNATNIYSSRTPSFTQQAKNISQLLPPFHLLPAVQQRPSQNLPPQLPPLSPGLHPGFGGSSNIYTAYNIGSPLYMSPGNNTSGGWDDGNSVPSKGSPTDTSHQQPQRPLTDPASGGEGGGSTTLLKVVSDRDGSTTRPGSGNGYGATIKNPNGPTLVGGSNVISSGSVSGADADGSSNINGGNNTPTITSKGNQVEKTQETAYTVKAIIPVIITICGIFLAAGIIAMFIYRKHLCAIGKSLKKKSKEEMAKKSNQSNISSNITEDSRNSMVMQHWNGPMAFNNRYVPWERDNQQHVIATSQLSTSSSTGNSQTKTDRWEFPRHRLKFFNILGEGAFGQVWRCEATDIDGNEGITTVAVKTLKENATEVERNDLYSELQVMKSLEPHVNVVRLLGCCTEKDPIFVVIEYVNRGKLQTYLRSSRAERHYGNTHGKSNILTSGDLTSFMYQVARGMDFLTSRGIIHRDLAARNILITDDHTCKVADFGFARDVITSMVYERKSEGKLPIRWMAIESLYDNIFSVKSDIWSFGILMWEIVTLGSTPYPGISAADVMKKVRDGYRLEKPEHCRRELYNIMYYCWAKDPNERPSFSELVQLLDKLLLTEMDYIELERFPDHNYYNMLSLSGEKL